MRLLPQSSPGRLLVLLLCLLAAGPADVAAAAQEPAAEPARKVEAITFEGAEHVPRKELLAAIVTTEANWRPWVDDRPFDQGTFEQDLERIRRLYERKGFYDAAVRGDVEEHGDAVRLHVVIQEGPQVVLRELALAWPDSVAGPPLDHAALARGLPLTEGAPFSAERYGKAKEELLGRLADLGHPAARLEGGAEVRLEDHTAWVEWTVHPGPFVRLGEAHVVGTEKVDAALVARERRWKPGEPYRRQALRKTQQAVFALGLFRSVSAQAVPPPKPEAGPALPEQTWPVEIRVQERPPRSVRVGAGYGTEDGPRARIEWRHRNLFGGLRSLRVAAKYSFLERRGEAVFVQPRFLDDETTLTIDSSWSDETLPAYDLSGVSAGWLLDRPLGGHWSGRLAQRFEQKDVRQVQATDTLLSAQEGESFRLVTLGLGLRRSTVDDELDPHRGTWLDLTLEPSLRALGSEVDYLRAGIDGRGYLPLGAKWVLATRLRLGTLEPFGGDSATDVPIFKRFFSGGSRSVRGFELDHLGPLDANGDPEGGLTVAEGSVELRFPIWRELGGVVFSDAGQVALGSSTLHGGDFFYSVGVGLRYRTPIGPLRLDVGHLLNAPDQLNDFRVYVSVGQAF